MMEEATIMMVTYNRLDYAKVVIPHVVQTAGRPVNLVVVDNGSTDGLEEYINNLKLDNANIHYHLNGKNKGIGVGRSQALLLANDKFPETKWFATIDPDVQLPNNWLVDCINILRDIPKYGMVGVNFEMKDYPLTKIKGYEFMTKVQGTLGGACTVFPKHVHDKVGYFCTEYGLYGQEDADFGARVKFAGYLLGYLKEPGSCLDDVPFDTTKDYVEWRAEYRKFKDEIFQKNLKQFFEMYNQYARGQRKIHIARDDSWMA